MSDGVAIGESEAHNVRFARISDGSDCLPASSLSLAIQVACDGAVNNLLGLISERS